VERETSEGEAEPGFGHLLHTRPPTTTTGTLRRCPILVLLRFACRGAARPLSNQDHRLVGHLPLLPSASALLPLSAHKTLAAAKPSHFYPITHPHRRAPRQTVAATRRTAREASQQASKRKAF
jgi:hypothetical protein